MDAKALSIRARLVRLVRLIAIVAVSIAAAPATASATTSPGPSPLSEALVLPDMLLLTNGQQERDAFHARLATPEAFSERRASQNAYRHLDARGASRILRAAFPRLVHDPAGGPPALPPTEHIARFWSPRVAQVAVGDKRAVIESALPMATADPGSSGFSPVDLTPRRAGHAFVPAHPLVPVQIPDDLGEGVALPRVRVSLVPTDGSGSPLDGAGAVVDGQTVLYANTATDADSLVKASSTGFSLDTILRSPASPRRLFYSVTAPADTRVTGTAGGGAVIRRNGKPVAQIAAPSATDAAGASVPLAMTVQGRKLIVTVRGRPTAYQWPVDVDPAVTETANFAASQGPWLPYTPYSWEAYKESTFLAMKKFYAEAGQFGYWQYHTQGKSEIYQNYTVTSGYSRSCSASATTYIQAGGTLQASGSVPGCEPHEYGLATCIVAVSCTPVEDGRVSNTAYWQVNEAASDEDMSFGLMQALIGVTENNASTVAEDTTDATLGGAINVLGPEGTGRWFNESAVIGFNAHDVGTGVYAYQIHTYPTDETGWNGRVSYAPNQGGQCKGIQCSQAWTFWTKVGNLPDGEDTVRASAENAAGLSGSANATVKVDKTAPELSLSGSLSSFSGKTVGELTYPLNVTVKDGTETTRSSGIRWAYIQLDGETEAEIGSEEGAGVCTAGPCSGSLTYNLVGAKVAEGQHVVTIKAEDYAGNWATRELTVTVNYGASSPVGPGTLDLSTGAIQLHTTDVSTDSPGEPLSVSRSYDSSDLSDGGSELGGQWQLNMPAARFQNLYINGPLMALRTVSGELRYYWKQPDGRFRANSGPEYGLKIEGPSAILTEASGNTTRFSGTEATGFTLSSYSPAGSPVPVFYTTETVGHVTRPHQIAAGPPGVSCTTLVRGCRALTFTYSTSTSAGEYPGSWGQYTGRLSEIVMTAWDHEKGEMRSVSVAKYVYDSLGRLRAEWDPRLEHPLKITYGYDTAEHVTAITRPGEQPTALIYGTISQESGQRLIAVTRPKATAAIGTEFYPWVAKEPTISNKSPALGEMVSVSQGTWKEKPITYFYQWYRCVDSGRSGCAAIGGATNPTYTPVMADKGYYLEARVNAVNALGSKDVNAWGARTNKIEGSSGPTEEPQQPAPPNSGSTQVTTIEYHVPVSGTGAPYAMNASALAAWGQTDDPSDATAVFPADEVPANPAADYKRATVYYLDVRGMSVNTAEPGGRITATEYDERMNTTRTLTAANRSRALEAGGESSAKSKLLDTELSYNAAGSVVSELGPQHVVKLSSGTETEARPHVEYTYNEELSPQGVPYGLATRVTSGAKVGANPDADVRTTTYSYAGQGSVGLKLRKPTSETIDTGGLNLVTTKLYDEATGEVTEVRRPGNPGGGDARTTETVYFTAGANPKVASCGNEPEWAGMACVARVAASPGGTLPEIPTSTTASYNFWGEPLAVTEKSGSQSRTVKKTYDALGRPTGESIEGSTEGGTPVPAVAFGYDPELGVLDEQTTGSGSTLRKLSSSFNSLGQLVSYTDADGNTTTYEYDEDERLTSISDGKGTLKRTYDATTGDLVTLKDNLAGKFTATYDADGNPTSEEFPGGVTAEYRYNSAGEPTQLTYSKASKCGVSCTWYSDNVVPTIHSQWAVQTTTTQSGAVNKQAFSYDGAARLTQTQETPPGGTGCITRRYAYDSDSDRTALTTRPPGAGGACATEGGTIESHAYDTADRLTDEGVTYDRFGNITTVPGIDVGGAAVKTTYYADNLVAKQTQGERTVEYGLDPAGRPDKTVIAEGSATSTVTAHFGGSADAPEWTVDALGNTTRYTTTIAGLAVTQRNAETPLLQITNLHGDVVATVSTATSATAPTFLPETTEFGAPRTSSTSERYHWLGAGQRSTDLPASGVVSMGVRTYIPELGRFSQTDPMASGTGNTYAYAGDDPVNNRDMGGMIYDTPFTPVLDPTGDGIAAGFAAQAVVIYQEAQAAARANLEAEEAAYAAAVQAREDAEFAEARLAFAVTAAGGEIDPYIGQGVWLAFKLSWQGLDTQFHFNKKDSLYISDISTAAAAAWVGTVIGIATKNPVWGSAAAAAIAGFSHWSSEHIQKNNCIGIDLYWPIEEGSVGYYRSKKECG